MLCRTNAINTTSINVFSIVGNSVLINTIIWYNLIWNSIEQRSNVAEETQVININNSNVKITHNIYVYG